MSSLYDIQLPPGFTRHSIDSETEEFYINMGPQHPSTHGVLRLVLRLDGETVREVVPHFGYIHRGIEKQAENQTYLQYIHLTDRFDYLNSHINNLGVCLAIEKAMNIGVPERGEYIRVIINELQRISSHLVFFGSFGADIGALSVFLYAFKERELISQIFDELSGARLTMNFLRPGGSFADVPDSFIPSIKAFAKKFRPALKEYHKLLTGNIIFEERTKNIGLLSKQQALDSGCSGPIARASGIDYDLRRDEPYSIYSQFNFEVPVRTGGDVYDRYMVRMEEMEQSLRIIEQAIAKFPEGPYRSKERPSYRLPTGTWTSVVETAKGQLGTFIVAEKGEKPYRIHSRSPSLANLSMLNEMCMDYKIADVVAILASLDPVIPEIDR